MQAVDITNRSIAVASLGSCNGRGAMTSSRSRNNSSHNHNLLHPHQHDDGGRGSTNSSSSSSHRPGWASDVVPCGTVGGVDEPDRDFHNYNHHAMLLMAMISEHSSATLASSTTELDAGSASTTKELFNNSNSDSLGFSSGSCSSTRSANSVHRIKPQSDKCNLRSGKAKSDGSSLRTVSFDLSQNHWHESPYDSLDDDFKRVVWYSADECGKFKLLHGRLGREASETAGYRRVMEHAWFTCTKVKCCRDERLFSARIAAAASASRTVLRNGGDLQWNPRKDERARRNHSSNINNPYNKGNWLPEWYELRRSLQASPERVGLEKWSFPKLNRDTSHRRHKLIDLLADLQRQKKEHINAISSSSHKNKKKRQVQEPPSLAPELQLNRLQPEEQCQQCQQHDDPPSHEETESQPPNMPNWEECIRLCCERMTRPCRLFAYNVAQAQW